MSNAARRDAPPGSSVANHADWTLAGEAAQDGLGAAEPGALPAAQVAGHRHALVEDALRPLARLVGPLRLFEELGVVDRQLGRRRQRRRLLEPRLRLFGVPEAGAGVCE